MFSARVLDRQVYSITDKHNSLQGKNALFIASLKKKKKKKKKNGNVILKKNNTFKG